MCRWVVSENKSALDKLKCKQYKNLLADGWHCLEGAPKGGTSQMARTHKMQWLGVSSQQATF